MVIFLLSSIGGAIIEIEQKFHKHAICMIKLCIFNITGNLIIAGNSKVVNS